MPKNAINKIQSLENRTGQRIQFFKKKNWKRYKVVEEEAQKLKRFIN